VLTKIQEEFDAQVVAINILPQAGSLEEWQAFLKRFGAKLRSGLITLTIGPQTGTSRTTLL